MGADTQFLPVTSCPVCGSADRAVLYPGHAEMGNPSGVDVANYACTAPSLARYFDIMQCKGCGLVYAGFRPSEGMLAKVYGQVVDSVYEQEAEGRRRTFTGAVERLNAACPAKGRLCEIGCYTGIFLELARQQGWDVCGVELSDWARTIASEKRGLTCFPSLDLAQQTGTLFDSVVLWDVIEHVPDPRSMVKQAADMLKPGGTLGLSTIVLDSLSARVLRHRYPFLMEMHLIYFTRKTLVGLLEECGFEIMSYKRHRRYVTFAYALGKYPAFGLLKRIKPLWAILGRTYFVSSVGLRDVFARKIR